MKKFFFSIVAIASCFVVAACNRPQDNNNKCNQKDKSDCGCTSGCDCRN